VSWHWKTENYAVCCALEPFDFAQGRLVVAG